MNKKYGILLGLTAGIMATTVHAGLFVSTGATVQPSQSITQAYVGTPSQVNTFSEYKPKGFGRDVPIQAALAEIIPPKSCWGYNLDKDNANAKVSWKGGQDWRMALGEMAKTANLQVYFNDGECLIGISTDAFIAQNLAQKNPRVWRIESGYTLRQNLSNIAEQNGWKLFWDSAYDYELETGATVIGDFVGQGGVVEKILLGMTNIETRYGAEFNTSNKVLRIFEIGHTQGEK